MKFFPLVWSMLWRSRARTWLTFLSIAVAFLLFGLLQAVNSGFSGAVRLTNDDVLMVTHRFGPTRQLPYAHRGRIEAVPGVAVVSPMVFFGGSYQDPKNTIPSFATDPRTFFATDARFLLPPEQIKVFSETRTGAVAGRDLADKYGWKIGDRIPLTSLWAKKDGSRNWEFELVGIHTMNEQIVGKSLSSVQLLLNYDYFDEARQYAGLVTIFAVRIKDPSQTAEVSKAIDQLFLNSGNETRTQTQGEFVVSFIKQVGDVGLILSSILAAVFFTLMLVAGNTMMQAFRERIPELAVLKTLGFTGRRVATLVVAESLLLCVTAGVLGLGLALLSIPPIREAVAQFFPALALRGSALAAGAVLAIALGLLAAVIPAWKSARLTVVDALAAR
jgi:putative ABC transport system permease protein